MSASYIASNFASTTLAGTFSAGATSATLTDGSKFPAPTNGDYTLLTLKNSTGAREIICIVGRSGNSITVGVPGSNLPNAAGRNYEGTTGLSSWAASTTVVECVGTAGLMSAAIGHLGQGAAAHAAAAIANTPTTPLTSTTVQAALNELAALIASSIAAVPRDIPSGTRMLFNQTTAPTGWTKDTTAALNDSALRIVTGAVGSGGTDAFSAHFGTGKSTASYTLTTADIPSHVHANSLSDPGHYHSIQNRAWERGAAEYVLGSKPSTNETQFGWYTNSATTGIVLTNAAAGGGGGHAHTLNSFNIKYVDFIIATRN